MYYKLLIQSIFQVPLNRATPIRLLSTFEVQNPVNRIHKLIKIKQNAKILTAAEISNVYGSALRNNVGVLK